MGHQLDLFSLPKYKIVKPVRLIELFAGIGSQAKALKNIGVAIEHYRVVEFDKYAIQSYNAVHGTSFETQDIMQTHAKDLGIVDTDTYEYIMTYSFPCTDLSIAGKMKGMSKDSGTRSGLLWEVERILDECKADGNLPQVLLMENVPQVIGEANKRDFRGWVEKLVQLGYSNYGEMLNAKDFGIPQNRERYFMVSILGEYSYEFPNKIPLKLRLKDMLEDEVDEKYYLSNEMISKISNWKSYQNPLENILNGGSISPTLTARGAGENHSGMVLVSYAPNSREQEQQGWVDVCPTLCARDYKDPKIVAIPISEATKQGYSIATDGDGVYINRPEQKQGVVQKGMIQTIKTSGSDVGVVVRAVGEFRRDEGIRTFKNGVIGTLRTKDAGGDKVVISNPQLRIRKLTPKECFRLMGFDDEDFNKAKSSGVSNSQLYKQAGNSIVVQVLEGIFRQLKEMGI